MDFAASNAFFSIINTRWNYVSKIFSLVSWFMNDFFNACNFLESSKVSIKLFFGAKTFILWYTCYHRSGIVVRNGLVWPAHLTHPKKRNFYLKPLFNLPKKPVFQIKKNFRAHLKEPITWPTHLDHSKTEISTQKFLILTFEKVISSICAKKLKGFIWDVVWRRPCYFLG